MGQQNIIELNGKKYDALSGALLGESRVKATPAAQAGAHRGRVIDGFMKAGKSGASTVIKPQPAAAKAQPAAAKPLAKATGSPKNMDIRRVASPKSHLKPHQPERPKTLMRHVVKKPEASLKPALKTTVPSEVMAAPKGTIAQPLEKKLSASSVNPFRLARSRHVAKSHHIRRFENQRGPVQHNVTPNTPPRPAQYASAPASRQNYQQRAPQAIVAKNPAAATAAAAPAAPAKQETSTDIFEAALAHATAHEQKTPAHAKHRSSPRRRLVNVMAGIGAFLLIGGFFAYMNMTNIELHVASARAGFHAQLPHFQATGYAMDGGIESQHGKVAINYRSGSSVYTVTQEASDWNSSTLLDQTTAERGQPAQTIQSMGRTIYIYDDSNATWVNGGVRYQVSGNASLNADDLVSLATSM